ncbi:hypothetical protein LQL77_32700, partial [Rhodococcus cerastii]|nr:hypothetical protein [Rhodococcus cerastii]
IAAAAASVLASITVPTGAGADPAPAPDPVPDASAPTGPGKTVLDGVRLTRGDDPPWDYNYCTYGGNEKPTDTHVDFQCDQVNFTVGTPGVTITVPASAATGSVSTDVHGGHELNVAVYTPDGRKVFHDRYKQ